MISHRSSGLYALHTIGQIGVAALLFWGWLGLFDKLYKPPQIPIDRYIVYCALSVAALAARAAIFATVQSRTLRQRLAQRLRMALKQTIWVAAAVFLFVVAAKDKSISRVFLFSWLPVMYASLAATNALLPAWLAKTIFKGRRVERTLVYAHSTEADHIVEWMQRQEAIGIQLIGCVTDRPLTGGMSKIQVLGTTNDLVRVLKEAGATQLLVPELPMFSNILHYLAKTCEERGVRLLVASNLERQFGQPVAIVEEDGLEFITLRVEPLESPFNRITKRMLDLAVALPVVCLILPFTTLVVWLFQRFQSPGSVFYHQPRAGLQGSSFEILKYRTMHVHNPSVSQQATQTDARIYPAGRWFRRMSIDELPQFINVLRGDMSVVGPRPHLAEHDDRWAKVLRNYHVRSLAKPGITGLAQVRGFRGEATTDEAIRLRALSDIDYIENWSLPLDVLIILRTFWHVVHPPETAY